MGDEPVAIFAVGMLVVILWLASLVWAWSRGHRQGWRDADAGKGAP